MWQKVLWQKALWQKVLMISGSALWGLTAFFLPPAPLLAQTSGCGLLNEAQLAGVLPEAQAIQQLSQVPGRCVFEWRKANAEELEKQNQERLRSSMQRGGSPYQPVTTWGKLSLEIRQKLATQAQAQAAFKQEAAGQRDTGFGSPDALGDQAFEVLKNDKSLMAWNGQSKTLLFQSGLYLLVLSLDVADTPEKNRDLALKIAPLVKLAP